MIVKTRWHFPHPAEIVWPLLCDSAMQPSRGLLFRLGLPQPRVCRLPSGAGGAGSTRQCVSDQGVIEQRIVEWDPPHRLSFRMERSDIPRMRWASDVVESFDLVPAAGGGTVATRTTRVEIAGRFRWLKAILLRIGLRRIHRFVFRNWARLARSAVAGDESA